MGRRKQNTSNVLFGFRMRLSRKTEPPAALGCVVLYREPINRFHSSDLPTKTSTNPSIHDIQQIGKSLFTSSSLVHASNMYSPPACSSLRTKKCSEEYGNNLPIIPVHLFQTFRTTEQILADSTVHICTQRASTEKIRRCN